MASSTGIDRRSSSRAIVVVTGPPGTGKSTVAEYAAVELGASLLAWDWLTAGLAQVPSMKSALAELDRADYRNAGWSGLWNLGELQLRLGGSVVFDGVAREPELQRARSLGCAHGLPVLSILTRCSDRVLHERHIVARRRDIPGWHELEWAYVARFLDEWIEPPTDVVVDAVEPLAVNLERVSAALFSLDTP